MPTTSSTQILVGSLLDLVGPIGPPARDAADRTVFDTILKQSPPAVSAKLESGEVASERGSGERDAIADSSATADPAAENEPGRPASGVDGEAQAAKTDANVDDAKPVAAEQTAGSHAEDSEESDEENVAVQSLAGLAAIVAVQAENLPAIDGSANEGEAEPGFANNEVSEIAFATKDTRKTAPAVAAANSAQTSSIGVIKPIAAGPESGHPERATDRSSAGAPVPTELALATTDGLPASADVTAAFEPPASDVVLATAAGAPKLAVPATSNQRREKDESQAEQNPPAHDASAIADAVQSSQAIEGQQSTPPAVAFAAPASAPQAQGTSNASSPAAGAVPATVSRPRALNDALSPKSESVGRRGAGAVDTARLIHRVARAVATAQSQNGEISLRLSPPELGSLKLHVQMLEGALSIRCEAETSAAKTALLDNLPALRERLAEQGVRMERFDVDLMQRQGSGTPDRPNDQQRDAPPPAPRGEFARERRASAAPERPRTTPVEGPGRLNVII